MTRDFLGNPVTAADPATLAGINDFVGGLLDYTTRALAILPAADAAPHVPLAQTYAGMLHMLAEAASAPGHATPYLLCAERAAAASPRERALAAALRAWVDDDIDATIAILTRVVADHPRDLAALKLLHYHLFNRGAFPEMLRAALPAATAWPDLPYLSGMLAFAYEQLHLLGEAEAAARHALATVPDDPWAQHALAHVMLTEGRIDEGADFLAVATAQARNLNSFMITHLWWHLALFRISQGREREALAAYDAQVWAFERDSSQDQIGAVSLLARLEMAGVDVGTRWDAVADYLVARADDVVQPFLSVQYLYGLARADRPEAVRLLAAIERAADRDEIWRDVALPLARGIVAAARGAHDEAAQRLTEILPRLGRIGGSHAQRDLFEQLLLDANIRSGRLIEAQQMLELRRAHDPDGVALNRQLADVYRRLDLPAQAAVAEERVRRRLAA